MCALIGAGPEVEVGRLKDIIHPDDHSFFQDFIDTILTKYRRISINYRITRPDGAVRFHHSEAEAILDGDVAL